MNLKQLALVSTALAFLCAFNASAQIANISTTSAVSGSAGVNLTTGMASAVSNTYFTNDGATGLLIKGGASAVTATIITQATSIAQAGYGSTALSNLVMPVPANAYVYVGPFPPGRWNTQYGTVAVSFTSVTGVSVSAISQAQ